MINVEEIQFSLSFVQWLIIAALGIYSFISQRDKASNEALTAVNAEVALLRERMIQVEADVKNMPSEATVRELIGKLEGLAAHNQGTQKQLESVQNTVNNINQFLLENR